MFLWGCDFIFRPSVCSHDDRQSQQCTGKWDNTNEKSGNPNNIIHETFYIHDIRFVIMGFL